MTLNEKKEYLNLYKVNQAKIHRFSQQIAEFPEDAQRLSGLLDAAQKTRDRIESEIECIGNPILSEVLAQRYQCGKTIEEIACCMNYSTRQIERLLRKAVACFEPTV